MIEPGLIELRVIQPTLTWSRFSGPRFQKISNINTSVIWGLVSNTTPFHRKQSRIDNEDMSNILLEKPAFDAKCLNLSSILKFESTQINLSLTGMAPLGGGDRGLKASFFFLLLF